MNGPQTKTLEERFREWYDDSSDEADEANLAFSEFSQDFNPADYPNANPRDLSMVRFGFVAGFNAAKGD
jgi:hypothetical protein